MALSGNRHELMAWDGLGQSENGGQALLLPYYGGSILPESVSDCSDACGIKTPN
jgi:hypothetical protein